MVDLKRINLFRVLMICSLIMVCLALVRCLLSQPEVLIFKANEMADFDHAPNAKDPWGIAPIEYDPAASPVEENAKKNKKRSIKNPLEPQLLRIAFYYEATEKESERFIDEQLIPTYEKLSNVTRLWMIPYGNIIMSQNSNGDLECLPLPGSCVLNMQHACVVDNVPDSSMTLKIIKCLIKFSRITAPNESLEKCCQEFHLPIFDKIRDCVSGLKGMELLKANGLTTHAAKDVYNGPFITINEMDATEGTAVDLFSLICKLYGNNSAIKEFCDIH